MPDDLNTTVLEREFQEFSSALLRAEEVVGDVPFSPETLTSVLNKICTIIATYLESQSCTVQLKLYDATSSKTLENMIRPVKCQKKVVDGTVVVSWRVVPGAIAYNLYRQHKAALSRKAKPVKLSSSITQTSYTDTDRRVKDVSNYFYKVVPIYGEDLKDRQSEDCIRRREAAGVDGWDSQSGQEGRIKSLFRPTTFPYILYPTGALRLVAANAFSPWNKYVDWLITELSGGLSTDIVLNRAAKVKRKMEIKEGRSQYKLGSIDPLLWTNLPDGKRNDNRIPASAEPVNEDSTDQTDQSDDSPLFFYNYYGVPIRIHQSGEVIGILKVENKGFGRSDENAEKKLGKLGLGKRVKITLEARQKIKEELKHLLDLDLEITVNDEPETIAKRIVTYLADTVKDHLNGVNMDKDRAIRFSWSELSYLSVAYLSYELKHNQSTNPDTSITLRDLCCEPYPPAAAEELGFPVQIWFNDARDECRFLDELSMAAPEDDGAFYLESRLDAACAFSKTLNTFFGDKQSNYNNSDIVSDIETVIRTCVNFEVWTVHARKFYKDHRLLCTVRMEKKVNSKEAFTFYVLVTPPPGALYKPDALRRYYNVSADWATKYCTRNMPGTQLDPISRDWEAHISTDRIVARVQALTFIFPSPEFTITDAWWLSWAALEIGKLIELQISYRGTNSVPVVPLTAKDFQRISISDMSFVDALRQQYRDTSGVVGMLQYHIPNHCRTLRVDAKLQYNDSRVKEFRSYLERIGREHQAHRDAVISTWLYLLSIRLGNLGDPVSNGEHQQSEEIRTVIGKLGEFRKSVNETVLRGDNLLKSVRKSVDASIVSGNNDRKSKSWFDRYGDGIFGDIDFSAAPLDFADIGTVNAPSNNPRSHLELLDTARKTVLYNLVSSPQTVRPHSADLATGTSTDLSDLRDMELFAHIFLRHDFFARLGISHYIYYRNLINAHGSRFVDGYKSFYSTCRDLIELFERTYIAWSYLDPNEADAEDSESTGDTKTDSDNGLALRDQLTVLRDYVVQNRTDDFADAIAKVYLIASAKDRYSRDVKLNHCGIYRRLRTVLALSSTQLSPQALNWEVCRFDYLGTRVNCLFRNQVFAVYEELWRRGDPFLAREEGTPELTDESKADSRVRWLSVRTNTHIGKSGYFGWHISALMDPRSFEHRDLDKNLYKIKDVRDYLIKAFKDWHEGDAKTYKDIAQLRHGDSDCYAHWFDAMMQPLIVRDSSQSNDSRWERDDESTMDDAARWASYPFRTPVDIIVRLINLKKFRKSSCVNKLRPIIEHIASFLKDPQLLFSDVSPNCWDAVYDKTKDLVGEILSLPSLVDLHKSLSGQPEILSNKKHDGSERWRSPDVRLDEYEHQEDLSKQLSQIARRILPNSSTWHEPLQAALLAYQNLHNSRVFKLMPEVRTLSHTWNRILQYVFLLPIQGYTTKDGKNWNAYDLFYYLMSLVPVEIQVRTALANTMAEQYHRIYKANEEPDDSESADVQMWRLQNIGRELAALDDEIEGQYESFALAQKLRKGT